MSRYSVEIKEQAQKDLKVLSKSEPKAYKKALTLISELHGSLRTGPVTDPAQVRLLFDNTAWDNF